MEDIAQRLFRDFEHIPAAREAAVVITNLRAELDWKEIANSRTVASMADIIRKLRADLAASQAECEQLRRFLVECSDVALRAGPVHLGLCDAIDNDGQPYQSQVLADELRAIDAARAGKGGDDDYQCSADCLCKQ